MYVYYIINRVNSVFKKSRNDNSFRQYEIDQITEFTIHLG